ncbi:MAG: hypothetical protein V1726_00435 [Methanobacteriota archaeon]
MKKETFTRVDDLVCPLCGSEKILTIRGEIRKQDSFQECKCTTCDGDFLVSYTVLRK